MSVSRKLIVQILTVLLILTTIFVVSHQKKLNTNKTGDPGSEFISSYEEKTFELQSKFILGLIEFMERQQGQALSSAGFDELRQSLLSSLQASMLESDRLNAKLGRNKSPALLLKEIILSRFLNLSKTQSIKCESEYLNKNLESDSEWFSLALRLCEHSPASNFEMTPETKKKLSWFSDIFLTLDMSDQRAANPAATQDIYNRAHNLFSKVMIAILVAFVLGCLSSILAIYFLSKLILRKVEFSFQQPAINNQYLLEIFFFYLLMMNILPLLLRFSIFKNHLLELNALLISSLSLLIFWPTLCGIPFDKVTDSLGLRVENIRQVIRDFFVGLTSYLASLVPIFIVLMVYSIVLMKLGIDIGSGAHPIVPILTKAKDLSVLIWIVLLTVVVAPVVEEIMFRGALYSWLRARLGAGSAIIISSLIFAAIHPQGAVGVLPLTCIGMVLALVREWRGNLTACMITHACFNAGTLLLAFSLFR